MVTVSPSFANSTNSCTHSYHCSCFLRQRKCPSRSLQ
uniref:Uncharacterized protein n=1 Tax=Arundo donax TaxID=35708 RepID=A0A0A9ATY2_ARUDO